MLHLHRAEQLATLVPALAEVLAHQDDDPLQPRVVAVSARGMERWLTQRLAHQLGAGTGGDGVCANVDLPSPRDLVERLLAEGEEQPDRTQDPWRPERLVWSILTVLQSERGQPWCALVADHLGLADGSAHPDRHRRRFGFALRIARHLGRYAAERPALLRNWRAGRDDDGYGLALPVHQQWQPPLFRALCEALPWADPVERTDRAVARLRAGPGADAVELCVFGPSRLDEHDLTVLLAAAEHRPVHLFLAHPSPVLWDRLAAEPARIEPRVAGTWAQLVRNPLLRSLAQDSREFQVRLRALLDEHRQEVGDRWYAPAGSPVTGSVLARLQEAVAADRDQPVPGWGPDAGAPTVTFHACPGAARQVEVLRDVVTGLLADDPTLEPRDVLVMCPQVETFAPLLLAAFGTPEDGAAEHPGRRIRVRLADRSVRQVNPVLSVLAAVLDLATARLTAEEVLDLLSLEPVRRRFRFDEDDLTRLREWTVGTGVKWGLTVRDRARFGVAGVADNTWHLGLDRLLLGVTMDTGGHLGRLDGFPLDGIDSTDVDRVGRFTEFVHRLAAALRPLTEAHPPQVWVTHLERILQTLTSATGRDAWQLSQARSLLLGAFPEPGESTGTLPGESASADRQTHSQVILTVTEVVDLLGDLFAGRPTRASFRTGDLTICSLVPMRSVPHRVVVLLGMDHDAYPRHTQPDGDDVLRHTPRVGELDAGGQERQILLDAVSAARERLVVLYSGADVRNAVPLPPARPIAELDEAVTLVTGTPAAHHRHPLNPYDPRPFLPGAVHHTGPLSFDRQALDGARARLGPRSHHLVGRLTAALPDPPPGPVDLAELTRFAGTPPEEFARRRLGHRRYDTKPDDGRIPLHLDNLAGWDVGEHLLRMRLRGATPDQALAAERRRGKLPPGSAGDHQLQEIHGHVERVVALSGPVLAHPPNRVDIDLPLPGGRRLTGTVTTRGRAVVDVGYAGFKAKVAMACWVPLLALVAATAEPDWTGVAVSGGKRAARNIYTIADPDAALEQLAVLVAQLDAGLREPLPMPARTGFQLAERLARGGPTHQTHRDLWEGSRDRTGERSENALYADLWPGMTYDGLLAARPLSAQTADRLPAHLPDGWFGHLVETVWVPALRHCRTES